MSQETIETLNTQTLIGYTAKRGTAWHYREDLQGDESNHYEGAIPVEDVRRRLFSWTGLEGTLTATAHVIDEDGVRDLVVVDPERKVIMRSDTGKVLGVFKQGYTVHQYDEWLLGSVASLLDADLAVASAGLLRGGGQAWVQIEMEDTLSVEGFEYRPFLTGATSMDGTLATTYITGAQAVVCDNTLSAALGSASAQLKIYHSSRSIGRLQDARDALGIVHSVGAAFQAEVETLLAEKVTPRRFDRFVEAWTNPQSIEEPTAAMKRKSEELRGLWVSDPRVQPWAGTAFGVMQAVNTWQHHLAPVQGAHRAERNMQRVVEGKVDALDRGTLAILATV